MSAMLCGGEPTPDDLAVVQEFQAALSRKTPHLVRLALLEMDTSGDPLIADALARHAAKCDQPECAPPCPFTFAHTRHWCGDPRCRES